MAIAPSSTLHCSNLDCLAENPKSNLYCHSCGSALLHRYLWVTGHPLPKLSPGDLIDDRYYVISARVVLDTRPGEVPLCPEEDIPEPMQPYLRLFSYRSFVPQVYGWLSADIPNCFLLEDAPLYAHSVHSHDGHSNANPANDQPNNHQRGNDHASLAGQLLPGLLDSWSSSSLHHQLNWLWQMARLWNPLSRRKVGSTLLDLHSLRIDGNWVRCLELTLDESPPSLLQLGETWTALTAGAHSSLRPLLQQLILFLQTGKLTSPVDLIRFLELGIQKLAAYQTYSIEISSYSDAGPSRKANEDNCFPSNVPYIRATSGLNSLAVVCDGLGGHEGGEVASNLAVSTLVEDLEQSFSSYSSAAPEQLLRQAIAMANDAISHQNNHEDRQERRRMGTTLVSLFNINEYFYLASVGDSRAYCISSSGCRQLTLDDDLASRHTRMGLGLYRSALDAPNSGALVQALGMVASQNLATEIQRIFLTEDALFLLCSDGVSDRDFLERIWCQELLPLLEKNKGIEDSAQRVVTLANEQNGHDNATTVLIKVNVQHTGIPSADELVSVLRASERTNEADTPTQIRPSLESPRAEVRPALSERKPSIDLPETLPFTDPPVADSPDADLSLAAGQSESRSSQPLVIVWVLLMLTIVFLVVGAWLFAPFIRSLSTPDPSPSVPSGSTPAGQ